MEDVVGPRGQNTVWVDGVKKSVLTRKEAAEFLGVTLVTLWKRTKSGIFNPIKIFGGTYYYQDDLIAPFIIKGKALANEIIDYSDLSKENVTYLKHLVSTLGETTEVTLEMLGEALVKEMNYGIKGLNLSKQLDANDETLWLKKIKLSFESREIIRQIVLELIGLQKGGDDARNAINK